MKKKADFAFIDEVVRKHFIKCHALCDNSEDLAAMLGISRRTVLTYCNKFKVKNYPPRRPVAKQQEVIPEPEYPPEFNCIEFVTEEQRDEWYNKDYY